MLQTKESHDTVISDMVRRWALERLPGDPEVAAAAGRVAQRAYAGGASVHDACEEARFLVEGVRWFPVLRPGHVATRAA